MNITHHPMDETLFAYVAGALEHGRALVVETHVRGCAWCRRSVALLELSAGEMTHDLPAVAMSDEALDAALEQLDRTTENVAVARRPSLIDEVLAAPDSGPWKWAGPGVHVRSLLTPKGSGARVFLLKAAPGLGLPHHTHTGTELTLVLSGAFAHAGGRFGPGDCDDADDTDEHNPVVEAGEACICLVAMDGDLKLQGLLGRIMQPFVRL
jgi:putative transcriptional regulator